MKKRSVIIGCAVAFATACGPAVEGLASTSVDEGAPPSVDRTMPPLAAIEDSGEFLPSAKVLPAAFPVRGRSFDFWIKSWWRWTFAVPAEQNPELVLDADCGIAQDERVFFVPLYDGAKTFERTCRVPLGKPVLVPIWTVINDYPCPDQAFEPAPGQSLEAFLREGAVAYNDLVRDLTVQWNGRAVDLAQHRHTGDLFYFQAHASLIGKLPDPCLQGTKQPGVSDGWWLMILPSRGSHSVRVRAVDPSGDPVDFTYRFDVGR
jgi:hypothetical protein